jgi:transcriptional regulator with XRE-family HTH domain
MKFSKQLSEKAILNELGSRIAGIRLGTNMTQAQLAEQAGISKRTVERLESGSVAVQISGLIRVCKVLGLIDRFDLLVPEPTPSPVEQVKLRRSIRRRASATKKTPPRDGWKWGDES